MSPGVIVPPLELVTVRMTVMSLLGNWLGADLPLLSTSHVVWVSVHWQLDMVADAESQALLPVPRSLGMGDTPADVVAPSM